MAYSREVPPCRRVLHGVLRYRTGRRLSVSRLYIADWLPCSPLSVVIETMWWLPCRAGDGWCLESGDARVGGAEVIFNGPAHT